MIHVIATVELNPGTRDNSSPISASSSLTSRRKWAASSMVPPSTLKPTSRSSSRSAPSKVTIIEKWEDAAALKAHGVAPHMQAYRARVKGFVRGMELRVLAPA